MSRLVWGCLWRGSLMGLGLGFWSGAIVGALTAAVMARFYGPLMYFAVPIGWAAGGFGFGAPVGLFVGMVDGLLVAILTRRWYSPPSEVRSYRNAAGALCAVASLTVVLGALAILGYLDFSTDEAESNYGGVVNQLELILKPV